MHAAKRRKVNAKIQHKEGKLLKILRPSPPAYGHGFSCSSLPRAAQLDMQLYCKTLVNLERFRQHKLKRFVLHKDKTKTKHL